MKIAVIGHPVHAHTLSAQFFVRALSDTGLHVEYLSLPDFDRLTDSGGFDFDVYVCWQNDDVAAVLVSAGRKVVLVPMYDDAIQRPRDYWRQFACCRIICFCRELYESFTKLDLDAYYFQYFPPAADHPPQGGYTQASVFFWQRRPESKLCLGAVEKLIGHWPITRLHLHTMTDRMLEQGQPRPSGVADTLNPGFSPNLSFSTSAWFNSRAEYISVLTQSNVFIAPRLEEGIGHSFLEAMALGLCVVAADQPTMNEYIYDGINGLLFDPARLGQEAYRLASPDVEKIGRCAQQYIAKGHRRWSSDIERLCAAVTGKSRVERLPAKAYERQIRNCSREWLLRAEARC